MISGTFALVIALPRHAGSLLVALLVFVTVAAILSGGPWQSQPRPDMAAKAHRLNELFGRLKSTTDEGEADAAAAEIWKLW